MQERKEYCSIWFEDQVPKQELPMSHVTVFFVAYITKESRHMAVE